eukprot:TRINITY_DN1314_c0_g1_i2.p1 TRINITY_DN1314_c0_g1~~TRINITY_DN1314_c0_g1_i2.p1  ORF type:complete len:264 (+),score=84.60 TRINITY_DN1314_c0_g1_i2:54-845(+)
MSPAKVSVMLSMVAISTTMGHACDQWVEVPSECAKQAGCVVAPDGMDCIPADDWATVWLQHPLMSEEGEPNFQPADTRIPGISVDKKTGGADFFVGFGNFLEKIPEFLGETHFHAVSSVSKDGGLKFECPKKKESGSCDFFVAVFSCAPCSEKVNGGLPQILTVTKGWEARSCAPVMMGRGSDDEYKMTIFRVRVANGHFVESPRFLRHARFIAVFSSVKETGFCPVPQRTVGPFPSGKKCGLKCPFEELKEGIIELPEFTVN